MLIKQFDNHFVIQNESAIFLVTNNQRYAIMDYIKKEGNTYV